MTRIDLLESVVKAETQLAEARHQHLLCERLVAGAREARAALEERRDQLARMGLEFTEAEQRAIDGRTLGEIEEAILIRGEQVNETGAAHRLAERGLFAAHEQLERWDARHPEEQPSETEADDAPAVDTPSRDP